MTDEKGYSILRDMDLKQFNSMRIHANAEILYIPYTREGLVAVCRKLSNNPKTIWIGKGSNIIFQRENYDAPIVSTVMLSDIQYNEGLFQVDCGTPLSELAWYALTKGITGYEFLEDIPGSVGGALCMNAGTYDDTISDLVDSVEVYNQKTDSCVTLSAKELTPFWGKRKSYFSRGNCTIISCCLRADCFEKPSIIMDKMLEIKKRRYEKQPREYPSAGSVFKRPYVNGEPRYVWKLLSETGMRGFRVGDAQVSEKHPGFIVNVGSCSASDVITLLNICKDKVLERYNIHLEEEWMIV